MKFPKTLFVRIDKGHNPGDEALLAYGEEAGAVDEDGPTEVAMYELVHVRHLGKRVVELESPKKKVKP